MYTLSDEQIDFMRNDIRARGVTMASLQQGLLDHVCCIVENDLETDGDFEAFYSKRICDFFKDELREVEQETIALLTFKHYYFMKKLMLFAGIAATVALTFGLIFKFMHLPGASILVVLGVAGLSLCFLPLLFVLKAREKQRANDRIVLGIGVFAGICIGLSVLFKVMHWPFANVLGISALAIAVLVFVPFYLLSGIRNPDTKVNTIVSSVLIVYACSLLLVLIRSPRSSHDAFAAETASVYRSERIFEKQRELTSVLSKSEMPLAGQNILQTCEEVKCFLIKRETGNPKIQNSGAALIKDGSTRDYVSDSPEIAKKLSMLDSQIETYNKSLSRGQQKIEGLSAFSDRRVSQTINDLIQAQMIVLQNQSALALR